MRFFAVLALGLAACADPPPRDPSSATPSAPPPPPAAPAPPKTVGRDEYRASYLVAEDFGGELKNTQDSRDMAAPADDKSYAAFGGQYGGLMVWTTDKLDAPLWRVVDIRWLFPSEDKAKGYLEAELEGQISEGMPPNHNVAPVGEDCHVFGGSIANPLLGGTITNYVYAFRVKNLVAKVYIAQGLNAPEGSLTALMVAPIAQKAVARMTAATR